VCQLSARMRCDIIRPKYPETNGGNCVAIVLLAPATDPSSPLWLKKSARSQEIPVRQDLEGLILGHADAAGVTDEAKDRSLVRAE
jgi:hypothetical protein